MNILSIICFVATSKVRRLSVLLSVSFYGAPGPCYNPSTLLHPSGIPRPHT